MPESLRLFSLLAALLAVSCQERVAAPPPVDPSPTALAQEVAPFGTASIAKEEASPPPDPTGFRFGNDAAGRLLERLLSEPPPIPGSIQPTQAPIDRPLPALIVNPEWPLKLPKIRPGGTLSPGGTAARPAAPEESIPLELARRRLDVPDQMKFPVGALNSYPAADLSQPLPLPTLARHAPDRASLGDQTEDFTNGSIINHKLPLRTRPAEFIRVNLPNPFENVDVAKDNVVLKEDPSRMPAVAVPKR